MTRPTVIPSNLLRCMGAADRPQPEPVLTATWFKLGAHTSRITEIQVARVLPTRLVLADGSDVQRDDPAVSYFSTWREAYDVAYERLRRAAIRVQEETEALEIYAAQRAEKQSMSATN